MNKKFKKFSASLLLGTVLILTLGGCALLDSVFKDFKEDWAGLPVTIMTYDENSQMIDKVKGKSVSIERDTRFDTQNSDGGSSKDSKVLNITLGGKEMIHVGSSLISMEDGIVDYFDEFTKTVDVENLDRSIPVMNRMANKFKNDWKPGSKAILVRSQNGTPLATFVGDSVRLEDTSVPSSTSLLIDGKRLFIYRCDYTIYDIDLLEK